MNIGIIGSGDVALALGTGFIKEGHAAKVSSRDPSKAKITEWIQAQGAQASVGSFSDAAKFGEVLVIATHWEGGATQNAIEMAGKENFNGKVVIDVTNPLDFSKGMPPTLEVSGNNSACEMIQSWLPQAKVVKAFNTVSNLNMYKPMFESRPDMFICGNDEAAKKAVSMILEKFGWGTLDIGDVKAARYIESVAMAYILHAIRTNNWNAALRLMTKSAKQEHPIIHFEIPAENVARAKEFYEKTFGWQIARFGNMEYWGVTTKEGGPGINGGLMPRMNPGQPFMNYITVESIDEMLAKVEANGGTVALPKQAIEGGMGFIAAFKDTEGNLMGLHQVPKK